MKKNISNLPCLTSKEASSLLAKNGFNELPASNEKNYPLRILLRTIREPMFLLLIICAILYLAFGSAEEALLLFGFVLIIITITFYQENKSERALLALQNLSSPRAFVIRDGKGQRISGREVVVNDIIVVNEGDRVPADSVLIIDEGLLMNESILTGESMNVSKKEADNFYDIASVTAPGGSDLPFLYSGTYVVQGKGVAKVLATGINTEIGKIGKNLKTIEKERTALQKETDALVRNFAIFGFALCILVAVMYGITTANWLNGFLSGIALAMAILPEEIPVVIIVFLAIGAWRISMKNVLTRQTPAIEALGAATVLCVDKTGTITQNRMSCEMLWADNEIHSFKHDLKSNSIPENFHRLIEFSILASQRDPFDPMEVAIKEVGDNYLRNTEHLHEHWKLVRQYPLSRELMAISLVWQSSDMQNYIIAAKGAPETIFDLCHLDAKKTEFLYSQVEKMADEGLRILGIAHANFHAANLPEKQHDFDFEFLGFVGLSDPVRPKVMESVQSCYNAGIRVIMITGDYAGTAQNIANKIGLNNSDRVITGEILAKMNDLELSERIKDVNIFARIVPEQKLRLVNALKNNGEIVVMTGDGVNDAPALKASHIGISMGGRGTDVARESSSLVLLNDDFSSIVDAIRLGRRIFDNIRKAIVYLFAAHMPIIGLSLIPIILKWPLLLFPAHIVFLQLVIDPTCSIVFEAETEDRDIMSRPPRKPEEKLFNRKIFMLSLFQGSSVLIAVCVVLFAAKFFDYSEYGIRTMVFTTLALSNISLILVNLSRSLSIISILRERNLALYGVIIGAICLLLCVLYVPFLSKLFYFERLSLADLATCFLASVVTMFFLRLPFLAFFRNATSKEV